MKSDDVTVVPEHEAARPANVPVHSYTFGPFRIDVSAHRLLKDEAVVPLTSKVFDTLLVLVKNHRVALSKEELLQAVWLDSFVSDDSLVQNISLIRRALGDDASQPQYIATLARRGYRFIGEVEEHFNEGPSVVASATDNEHIEPNVAHSANVRARKPRPESMWIVTAFISGAVVATLILLKVLLPVHAARTDEAPLRFRESVPSGQALTGDAILSPNGRQIAFIARSASGVSRVWVRVLGGGPAAHSLEGTTGATDAFWSPDGRIKRVSLESGSTRVLAATQRGIPQGGSWGRDDLILYADKGKIFSVSASGGTPSVAAEPDQNREQGELRWPHFLPDGQHFLFYVSSDNTELSGIYLGTIGSRVTKRLVAGSRAVFAPPYYLIYLRDRILMAQKFDLLHGIQGRPMTIASDIWEGTPFSSAGGLLIYSNGLTPEHLVWLDRQGKKLSSVSVPKPLRYLTLSPNNKQLLGASVESGNWIIWLIDLARNVSAEIVRNGSLPAWAPDGLRFAFTSMRSGEGDIFVKTISAPTDGAAWLKSDDVKTVEDWSSDGRYIVYTNQNQHNIWLLPTFGDRKPLEFLQTHGRVRNGKISPDRHWIAYVSDETGDNEVYLQSFPTQGSKRRVSTNGGRRPIWRQDGQELFYLSNDKQMMSVAVNVSNGELGNPQPLFLTLEPDSTRGFAVTRDGQRFLVVAQDHSGDEISITVLTNWEAAQTP